MKGYKMTRVKSKYFQKAPKCPQLEKSALKSAKTEQRKEQRC